MPWWHHHHRISQTTTFKAKVPNARFKKASAVLQRPGLSAGEAFNLLLAQIEIHKALPFGVSLQLPRQRHHCLEAHGLGSEFRGGSFVL